MKRTWNWLLKNMQTLLGITSPNYYVPIHYYIRQTYVKAENNIIIIFLFYNNTIWRTLISVIANTTAIHCAISVVVCRPVGRQWASGQIYIVVTDRSVINRISFEEYIIRVFIPIAGSSIMTCIIMECSRGYLDVLRFDERKKSGRPRLGLRSYLLFVYYTRV